MCEGHYNHKLIDYNSIKPSQEDIQITIENLNKMNSIDTVFFSTSTQYSAISSSVVKEYASYGVSVKDFVPAKVLPKIEEKYKKL